ncbi:MAG: hypothetical protein M1823_000196 [Watsoniomyces obsoletus]|nr:MAG: hypothetical protein M1823_000196 [Watsoniomyces obsoletus]
MPASGAEAPGPPVDELTRLQVDAQGARVTEDHVATPLTPRTTSHSLVMATPSATVTPSTQARFSAPRATASFTPPPSTQVHSKSGWATRTPNGQMEREAAALQTPTPSTRVSLGHLTSMFLSPPPGAPRFTMPNPGLPTNEQIVDASPIELQCYLGALVSEVEELSTHLANARASEAHHELQYTLLRIESDETAKRMAVEHEMTRREVEVLRQAQLGHRQLQRMQELEASPRPVRDSSQVTAALRTLEREAKGLRKENEVLRRRMGRAKKLIRLRDGQIQTLEQEGQRLRQRIKENREHLNLFRRSLGVYDGQTPRILDSPFMTAHPQQTPQTPHRGGEPRSAQSGSTRGPDNFAALLLADQVLSQGNNTQAPSTAGRTRAGYPGHASHGRATQSLSSLPPMSFIQHGTPSSDPAGSRSVLANDMMMTHTGADQAMLLPSSNHQERQRSTRDSTISASDGERSPVDRSPAMDRQSPRKRSRGGVVEESEASQLATHLLRRPAALAAATRKLRAPRAPPPPPIRTKTMKTPVTQYLRKDERGNVVRDEKGYAVWDEGPGRLQ